MYRVSGSVRRWRELRVSTEPRTYPYDPAPRRTKVARYLGGPREHETLIEDLYTPWAEVVVVTGGVYQLSKDVRGRPLYVWEQTF
jgi:hypothetical protein